MGLLLRGPPLFFPPEIVVVIGFCGREKVALCFQAKLESYRELQRSGKDLNSDQKTAVAKYDEVIQTLDFAKELCKQFLGIAAVSEKEAKKLARKEALARSQSELAKVS